MDALWLGASKKEAICCFLLPNRPILPISMKVEESDLVAQIIELNGNHWRKIFTIMAKLITPEYLDWRDFRDKKLLKKVAIVFSIDQLELYDGLVFIVGNTFRDDIVVPDSAITLGDRHIALALDSRIWCPYLDYRQFPNVLIEALRQYIAHCILENSCFKL